MTRSTLAAHLALFTVNFIYGLNYVVAKGLMPVVIGPSGFILLRVLGATLLFWLLYARKRTPVPATDIGRLALCAVFGVAVNQLMFFHGLMRTTPVNASIIMVATPVLVLALSAYLLGERLTWLKITGVFLGAIGALIIVLAGADPQLGSGHLGDLFILINASSYAVFLVLVKPLMRRYDAVTVMAWCFLFGLMMVTPFGWKELSQVAWSDLSTPVLLAMGFVVVMVTFVAYLLNTWAIGRVDPGVVGSYIYLQPALALGFSWLFMYIGGERLGIPGHYAVTVGPVQVISTVLIFLGVYLVGRRSATV
ncbi:MAG: DMT family transporter [Flavobacteriales bacterium]